MKGLKIFILVHVVLFAGMNRTFAQTDTTTSVSNESLDVIPLQKFDFGILSPNADTSKAFSTRDYRNLISSEGILKREDDNISYAVMATAEEDESYTFGQIPYQESITPYGGRTYSIPIMVSPTTGFPPQISLIYNSQSGNGLAGYGWNIGGLSSITISNKTLYYNEEVVPADVDDPDAAYSLDGIPLVRNDDPALADEYPLETARGHILVKKHLSGSEICYFTVLYPDGSKATFGTTSNDETKSVYPMTQWEDRLGNQIIYGYNTYYEHLDPYYAINHIQFKHKANNSYAGRIDFSYADRTDYHAQYRAGKPYYHDKILKAITSVSQDSTLCTYSLTHEFKDGANLLTSIGCTNSSGAQLRPLTFSYGIDQHYEVPPPKDLMRKDSIFLSSNYTESGKLDFIYNRGKMLASNFKDGLVILPKFSNYGRIEKSSGLLTSHFKYGSTYVADQDILVAPDLASYSKVSGIKAGSGFQCIYPVDIDGNGVDEIVKVNFYGTSSSTSETYLQISVYDASTSGVTKRTSFLQEVYGIFNDGDVFISPVQRCYLFGDFKGDGKIQLLTISFSSNQYYTTNESYASLIDLESGSKLSEQSLFLLSDEDYADGKITCIDMDGDGKTELCHLSGSNLNIYNFSDDGFTLTKTISTISSLLAEGSHLTDINGDGYIDVATEPVGTSSYWYIYCYTGHQFTSRSVKLSAKSDDDKYQFFDINKDGLPDLIQRNGKKIYIYLNENGTFNYDNRITSSLSLPATSELINCNVTGLETMSDFITAGDTYVYTYGFNQNLAQDRLLTIFTNSLGAVTRNGYEDMSASSSAYKIDPSREYAQSDGFAKCRFPLHLLHDSQNYLSSAQDGDSMLSNLTYMYYDACVHSRGLGFCGFGKVRITSFGEPEDKEFVTIETRSPELMGATVRLVRGHMQTMNDPYDITEYTYDTLYTTYGKLNPRLIKEVHTDTLSSLKTTTTYSYDPYDFPTSVSVHRSLGGNNWFQELRTMEYQHSTTSDCYCFGNILSDTRIKSTPILLMTLPTTGSDRPTPGLTNPGLTNPGLNPVTPNPGIQPLSRKWFEKQVYTYDARMQPIARVDSVGSSESGLKKRLETRWTYDSHGHVLTEMSAPYNVTEFIGKTYTYDDTGRFLLTLTDELGQTTTFSEHNKYGKPLTVTDYAGRVTTDVYDDWGNLVSRTTPDGTVSSVASGWSSIGCYYIRRTVTGKPTEMRDYDAAGREVRKVVTQVNGNFKITDKVYDRNGNLLKESLPHLLSPTSNVILWNTYDYDEYLRPVSYTHASGNVTTWAYDKNTITESKNGIWSIKTLDANGQTTKVQDAGGTIQYTLRPDGQPSKVTMTNGGSTTFAYDTYGRRTKIEDPSAGTQTDTVAYNPDGSSVATHTNPNGCIITYADKFGRKTKIERQGEYDTDYVYDENNRLVSETSSNGTSKAYTYDKYDRLSSITETVPDGKWLKKRYSYTSGSNLLAIIYSSQSGTIGRESFTYSFGHKKTTKLQTNIISEITALNLLGQPTAVTTGGITRTYSYNAYGQPTRRTMGSVMDCSYSFDPLTGNLLSRTDNLRNQTETFGYDALNRLVLIDDREISYADNGNITGIDSVGDMTYGNSDKPYQVTSLTLEEDVVPSLVQNIAYTCYSRPSIMTEGGRSAAFTYNADGERVKMNISNGTISVLSRYYIGNQYEVDVTPYGTTERLYLGGDAYSAPMVYIKVGSGAWTLYNIGRDYLGNITHIATADGTLVEENSYDPWGRLRNPDTKEIYSPGNESELLLGRGYTGHEHLTWFGLINMNARLYDPVLGRFLSPDPFIQMPDFTQNFNRYSYCLNNPLVYSDESGEFFIIDSFIIGLFTGGWNKAIQMAKNDAKIWGGLFVSDPNKSRGERIWEVLSRFIYQPIQTLLGFLTAHAYNSWLIYGGVESVDYLYGATVVPTRKNGWGAVTQGSYIVGDADLEADPSNALFQHEYGHYIQSQTYGYLYYGKFGIPSAMSKDPHDSHPVEQDANIRALKYYYENGLYYLWDKNSSDNEIHGYIHANSFYTNSNQVALSKLIKLNWYDFVDPIIISGIVNACILNTKY